MNGEYGSTNWRNQLPPRLAAGERILTPGAGNHTPDVMDEEHLVSKSAANAKDSDESRGVRYLGLPEFIDRLPRRRIVLAVCVLSCLAYANSLAGDFVLDDLHVIVGNRDIRSWSNIERAFTTHLWAFRDRPETLRYSSPPAFYRPILTVVFTTEYHLFGLWPQGWHLVSLLLHILCSIGVYYVLLLISRRNVVAALTAALFAIYPIHVESISWISAVNDPLFGVFFLWSFYFYLKYRLGAEWKHLAVSLLLFLLSTFSKETALSMVALVFFYELIESTFSEVAVRPGVLARVISASRVALIFGGVAAVYLIARYEALGALTWKTLRSYEGPLIHTLYTLPSVIWLYLCHLIWPVDLSFAYGTSFITSVTSPSFLLPAIALVVSAALLVFYRKRISRQVWHAMAWLIVPLLPVLDLRHLAVDYLVFDRYLYVSTVGWAYLIAVGVARLSLVRGDAQEAQTEWRSPGVRIVISSAVVALLLIGLTAATARENRKWADSYALWSQAARVRPQYWSGHYNEGVELLGRKRYAEALQRLMRAAELTGDEPFLFDTLGRAYDGLGDTENAITNFKRSIALDPTMFESLNNLGTTYFRVSEYEEAEKQFLAALGLKPQAVETRFNLGLCYQRLGRYPEAAAEFELAVRGAPEDAEAHFQLGLSYEKLGRPDDAIGEFQRGLSQVKSQDLSDQISEGLNRLRSK
jgi:tetratricopeptide (TPR) repeat protein